MKASRRMEFFREWFDYTLIPYPKKTFLGKGEKKNACRKARTRNKASSSLPIPESSFPYFSKKAP